MHQLNGFIGVNFSIYAVFHQTWYADGQNATSMLAKLALYYREQHRSVSNNQKMTPAQLFQAMQFTANLKTTWAFWSSSKTLSSLCWSRLSSFELPDVDLLPGLFCPCSDCSSWFWDFCSSFNCQGERQEK